MGRFCIALIVGLYTATAFGATPAQGVPSSPARPSELHTAQDLYTMLASVGIAQARVYQVRDAAIDRKSLHITLDDGTIAFTEDIGGHITGAFFEGDGDLLLLPPDRVERGSLALFTGAAVLEEKFSSAYLRFNDETFAELQKALRPAENAPEFVTLWGETAKNLSQMDPLRLFMTFSRSLPVSDGDPQLLQSGHDQTIEDRFLHGRIQGRHLGTFDIYYDSTAAEQVWAGQLKAAEGEQFYDVWASFSIGNKQPHTEGLNGAAADGGALDALYISSYKIRARVAPPTLLSADAMLQLEVRRGGQRTALFELSRFLQVKRVEIDGHPAEIIHNESPEGTQRARRRDDLVGVVFPAPLRAGQKFSLHFVYEGEVLSEAARGLLYVGERGTWYPNRGLVMSLFDLEFRYPSDWTLVATGEPAPPSEQAAPISGEKTTRWVSKRPMPVAGFNLGKYSQAVAKAGDITVETYATVNVERAFPRPPSVAALPPPAAPRGPFRLPLRQSELSSPTPEPSPADHAQAVTETSARAVEFFSHRFGPFPYDSLKLTQMPGRVSQGWPGLIFLSSISFLNDEERARLFSPVERTMVATVVAHETAHQWWGDLVGWSSYRDQWIGESLANYSALMMLESSAPAQFHQVMEKYRDDLLEKQHDARLMDAGPVTLGSRLSCSVFPRGYLAISYGRGTWLMHMLHNMFLDAEAKTAPRTGAVAKSKEQDAFVRSLRKLRDRFQEKPLTTREFLQVFEEDLPRSLWFEGKKSLGWFYDGWVNGTAVPKLELHDVRYSDAKGPTMVSGIVVQADAPPDLVTSVPVYAVIAKKSILLGRVFAEGPATQFQLSAPQGTRKVVLDPNQTVLSRPH